MSFFNYETRKTHEMD